MSGSCRPGRTARFRLFSRRADRVRLDGSEDGQVAGGDDPGRVRRHRVVDGGGGVGAGEPSAMAVHVREHRDDVAVATGRAAVDDLDGEEVGALVVHGEVVAAAGDLAAKYGRVGVDLLVRAGGDDTV